ncbi:MAG: hypothetical protein DWQ05_12970 [Calditrichaeota bacterium]|nr:MAG: hypothetical protein DWQ05_12970 [Calditrichota bacterium]
MKSIRKLKFSILAYLSTVNKQNKTNILGRSSGKGNLEIYLNIEFDNEERHHADKAFEELKNAGLIHPTYSDLIEPENWIEITDRGRKCYMNQTLDALDEALLSLDKSLLEIRDGAWVALEAKTADSLRQAAHSGRELITHVLHSAASDDSVTEQNNFQKDISSKSGITRRQRINYILKERHGKISKNKLKVIEKACDLVLAINDELQGASHSSLQPNYNEIKNMLNTAEMALEKLLVSNKLS